MVTEFQKRKIFLAFYKFDTSKDGIVDVSDWELQAKRVAEALDVKPGTSDYEEILKAYRNAWDGYFKPADTDGDGKVTSEEYFNTFAPFIAEGNASLEKAMTLNQGVFDAIDLDGSGKIDAKEFRIYFKGLNLSEEDAKVAFSKLDTSGDGTISREEFAQAMYEYFTSNDPDARGNWFYGSY